jgi:pimeloyl-ACP methyl ester carboxylesterase
VAAGANQAVGSPAAGCTRFAFVTDPLRIDAAATDVSTGAPVATDFDLLLPSGHLRAHRFGDRGAHLVLCAPGLSANSRWFDYLAEHLAGTGRQVVALDLRGRGNSAVTPAGTYGYKNHARDLFAAADALGAERFDLLGHSMGAYVGMEAAALDAAARIRRLVLIDGLGIPRYAAIKSILRNLQRLNCMHPSPEHYLASIRALELIDPWNEYWDRLYRYELVEVPGGVRARTHREPVSEDFTYGNRHDARQLWQHILMPVLALRAARSIAGRNGFIVTEFDLRHFHRTAKSATTLEIDANHYDIMTHADTLAAVRQFFDAP